VKPLAEKTPGGLSGFGADKSPDTSPTYGGLWRTLANARTLRPSFAGHS